MERTAPLDIDLGEWELLLPDDQLLLSGRSFLSKNELFSDPKGIVDINLNYFSAPPPRLVPDDKKKPIAEKKLAELPAEEFKDIGVVVPPPIVADRNVKSQVLFKKLNQDSQFADMKTDSPNIDIGPIPADFEDKLHKNSVPEREKACRENFGFTIWRWRLSGVGAICSIGVAAATLCVCILGSRKPEKHHHRHHQQSHKIQFEIYADEKRMKQVVQQATRVSHVLRGAPVMNRAQVSFGGYYDGL